MAAIREADEVVTAAGEAIKAAEHGAPDPDHKVS